MRVLLTPDGAERLQDELARLKKQDRPAVIQAIAEARAHGDLSENAEYHAAREQQGFIEGRIAELDSKLSVAEVINPVQLNANGKVVFGAWVDLWEEEGDREVTYRIVGELEANIDNGLISHSSPIAKALIGKTEGVEIEFQAPSGLRRYEVLIQPLEVAFPRESPVPSSVTSLTRDSDSFVLSSSSALSPQRPSQNANGFSSVFLTSSVFRISGP